LVGPIYVLNAATPQITGLKVIPRLSLNVGVYSPATGSCVTTTHPLPHNLASVTGSICPMWVESKLIWLQGLLGCFQWDAWPKLPQHVVLNWNEVFEEVNQVLFLSWRATLLQSLAPTPIKCTWKI